MRTYTDRSDWQAAVWCLSLLWRAPLWLWGKWRRSCR